MCQTPYVVVKNYMELLAFDAIGVAAINLVVEAESSDDYEPWLLIALLSLSTMQQINEATDWLKTIHQRAKLAEKPMLLAIHLSPLMLTHPQERVEFLRTLNYLADSVILISPLEDGMPAQALARLPQFLVDTVFRPGMINLDCLDLSNRMQLGIAFFAYGLQRHSDDRVHLNKRQKSSVGILWSSPQTISPNPTAQRLPTVINARVKPRQSPRLCRSAWPSGRGVGSRRRVWAVFG